MYYSTYNTTHMFWDSITPKHGNTIVLYDCVLI